MNKEKLSKTINLLIHQNLCVVNNGTKEKPDFVVGGTELLNKELTKLFSLYGVGCSLPTEKEIAIEAERRHPYKKHFVDYSNGMNEGFIDGTDFVLEAIKKTK